MSRVRLSLLTVIIICCSNSLFAQLWSGVLSSSRGTNWTYAGVTGGIPSGSWGQCGSTISAYGTSTSPASPSTITSALSNCSGKNEYVQLGAGTFYLSTGICMTGLNNVEFAAWRRTQPFWYSPGRQPATAAMVVRSLDFKVRTAPGLVILAPSTTGLPATRRAQLRSRFRAAPTSPRTPL